MAKTNLKAVDETSMMDQEESLIEYSINLEEQEKPPLLPVGEYRAEVVGFEKKFGKDSGNPYFNVKLRVNSESQPADFVEALGTNQPITLFYMFFGAQDNPVERFNMKQFCQALGVPLSNRFNPQDFLNKECKVLVNHNGKDLAGNPDIRVQKIIRV